MELILELFYEKHRVDAMWKSIVRAAVIVLALSGIYQYLAAFADGGGGFGTDSAAGNMPKEVNAVVSGYAAGTAALEIADMAQILVAGRGADSTANDSGKAHREDKTEISGSEREKTADQMAYAAGGGMAKAAVGAVGEYESTGRAGNSTASTGRAGKVPAFSDRGKKRFRFTQEKAADAVLPPSDREAAGKTDKITGIITAPKPVDRREISGFLCNERGHIIGYSDPLKFMKDSLAVLPRDSACTGITKGAFDGLEKEIAEIFITANITYIEEGVFDHLENLVFIEADPRNPEFYSVNGVLYTKDGRVFAYPRRMM